MLINTVLMPLRLYLLSLYGVQAFDAAAEGQVRFWRAYRSWLRKKLREERAAERQQQQEAERAEGSGR